MGFGHYTAFARDYIKAEMDEKHPVRQHADYLSDQWHCFDDDVVKPCESEHVKTRAAYILFYRKRN
jgi:ubiquitin C-terminal hydrolase